MALFMVEKIINSNTIQVNPNWKVAGFSGNKVVISGYNPALYLGFAKTIDEQSLKTMDKMLLGRVTGLLSGKMVELRLKPLETSDCIDNINNQLKCSVYLNSINIEIYFPDFKDNKVKK